MSEEAIENWEQLYPAANTELRVWMGQILLYSEKVNRQLGIDE